MYGNNNGISKRDLDMAMGEQDSSADLYDSENKDYGTGSIFVTEQADWDSEYDSEYEGGDWNNYLDDLEG